MKTLRRTAAAALLLAAAGCQQKMAEQPAPRPYEEYDAFPNKQSARPLEGGTVHRGQRLPDDPMVSWLTPAGKAPKVSDEWKAAVDPNGQTAPPPGAPTDPANYVTEFPFEMTEKDLKIGQTQFNIYCGVCHGATGAGNGKIVERGYLRPPSYHTDPTQQTKDWGFSGKTPDDIQKEATALPAGYSRGFGRYRRLERLDQVPVGYIFQVITWGYGGMPDLGFQVTPENRWRIIAYIRALQLSQNAELAKLPADERAKAEKALAPKAGAEKKADH